MTIEKAFEWLFKRFKTQTIKPCTFDIDCLKFLAEWANREKEKNKQENILFAKLFCYVFIQEIQHFKDINFAQKSMHDILNLPLELHYQKFAQKLNDFEFNQYLKSIGINSEAILFSENEADKEKLKNAKYFFENLNKWDLEKVTKSLNNQITESINRYDHKP
jgi:DNA integrity scanning protein DisA with diadenylate cyclase activity